MIPDVVRTFLSSPRFLTVVLADGLVPRMFRCAGYGLDGDTFTAIIPPSARGSIEPFLTGTHRAAVAASSLNFEAFQVKGPATVRAATPDECARAAEHLATIGAEVERLIGLSQAMYTSIDTRGSYAIDVRVEESFAQSPRPGAGARLGGAA